MRGVLVETTNVEEFQVISLAFLGGRQFGPRSISPARGM